MILKNENNDTCLSDGEIDGWVEITREELDQIRASRVVVKSSVEVIEAKKQAVRAVRKNILDILAGITTAALVEGDTDTPAAYLAVRQGLLDITEDWPTDSALVDALVVQRYSALVAQCTPQMVGAFAQVAS